MATVYYALVKTSPIEKQKDPLEDPLWFEDDEKEEVEINFSVY
jgi:hypothetical protein